jgi:hypothetical protein
LRANGSRECAPDDRLREAIQNSTVITGLVPVIHVLLSYYGDKDVDGRVKPGHDRKQKTPERMIRPGVFILEFAMITPR